VNSFSSACDKHYVPSISTYYSLTDSYAINTYLYTNQACTAQYKAPAGYYSNGADYFVIDSNGKITQTVIQGCPSYWYYPMSSCDGLTNVTGRSSSDISITGPITVNVSPNTCYVIHLDFGTTSFHEDYTYNIDNLTPVTDCYDSNCVAPPTYGEYIGKANNGDRGDYSESCGPLGVHGTGLWTVYTYNNEPLTTGTKIYVSPIDAMNQNQSGLSDPGAFSYGGYWYLTAGGVLGDRNSC
jgi:hypothetical protein